MAETTQRILAALDAGPTTGPELACRLDITRAAVWNQVEALREAGFEIDGTAEGYLLEAVPEYGQAALAYGLDCPASIEYHERIESTTERAKALAAAGESDVAVVANEQTAGRGRLDRNWTGPPGGIYLSLLLRPALTPVEAPILTMIAAVAAVEAVAPSGVETHIKWPNDVMVPTAAGERKLAGILTSVAGEADRLRWAIVGIGINANVPAGTLPDGATSLSSRSGGDVNRRPIVQTLLEGIYALLEDPDAVLPDWRQRAGTLGRRVRVTTPDEVVEGVATDVEHPGVLLVDTGDDVVRVHAGDCDHLRPVEPDGSDG